MSTRDADLVIAVDLLKSASAILKQYRELTNRPPIDDLTLYEWAVTDHDATEVLARAIEQDVYLWNPMTTREYDHVMQAEMDRACTVIEQLMHEDEEEEPCLACGALPGEPCDQSIDHWYSGSIEKYPDGTYNVVEYEHMDNDEVETTGAYVTCNTCHAEEQEVNTWEVED